MNLDDTWVKVFTGFISANHQRDFNCSLLTKSKSCSGDHRGV